MTAHDPTPVIGSPRFRNLSDVEIARQIGVSDCTIRDWRRGRNRISDRNADRIAIEVFGLHPALLWDTWL